MSLYLTCFTNIFPQFKILVFSRKLFGKENLAQRLGVIVNKSVLKEAAFCRASEMGYNTGLLKARIFRKHDITGNNEEMPRG